VLVVLLQIWQEELKKEVMDEISLQRVVSVKSTMSILPAVLVSVINMCLVLSSSKLASLEYHLTKTAEAASTALKMTTAQILDTSLVVLIINSSHVKQWYSKGGLCVDLWWMLLINAFVAPLFSLLDFETWAKCTVRWVRSLRRRITQVPRDKGEKMLKFWEPSEFYSTRQYSTALQTFIACSVFQPVMPQALLFSLAGVALQYGIDKWMLLRVHKRPSFPEGPGLAYTCLLLVRIFVSLTLPIAAYFFLRPSVVKDDLLTLPLILGLLFAVLAALMPDRLQRGIVCTCCYMKRMRFSQVADGSADEIDYYQAQYFWPKSMKYHKAHLLYKELPHSINPENLSPTTGALSTADIRGNYAKATEQLADDRPSDDVQMMPMLVGGKKRRFRPADLLVISADDVSVVTADSSAKLGSRLTAAADADHVALPVRGSAASAVASRPPSRGSQAGLPGSVGTQVPVWKYEVSDGWHDFDKDCQEYIEQRFQDFRAGSGGPSRKVKTCGKEVLVNFQEMSQSVEGSHKVRKIRRVM